MNQFIESINGLKWEEKVFHANVAFQIATVIKDIYL